MRKSPLERAFESALIIGCIVVVAGSVYYGALHLGYSQRVATISAGIITVLLGFILIKLFGV